MYKCTDQGPWVGGQEPNLVGQWVVIQGLGGRWMMGQTHDGRGPLLVETSASSPSDEGWRKHAEIQQGTEI